MRWRFTGARLEQRAFTFDYFLDLLLSVPGLHIAFQIDQFQIHLIEHRLGPVRLVEDGRDIALHHECAHLFAGRLLGILARMDSLLAPFVPELFAFCLTRNEGHLLRVVSSRLKIGNKGLGIDMLMAAVHDGPYHDNRLMAFSLHVLL